MRTLDDLHAVVIEHCERCKDCDQHGICDKGVELVEAIRALEDSFDLAIVS